MSMSIKQILCTCFTTTKFKCLVKLDAANEDLFSKKKLISHSQNVIVLLKDDGEN